MRPLAERYRLPISQGTRLLAVAILLLLLAGVAVAGVKAGDDTSSTAAQATTTTTSTTEAPTSTTTEPEASTTTTAVEAGGPDSGLGASGSGSVGQADDLANTGGLPLAVPGGVLLALAVVSRRLASR